MPISNILIPWILNKIRKLNTYSDEDIDMMRYSLQVILWETEKLLILGVIFALLHRLDYFLITLGVLLTIRTNAGGYHSNSSFGCLAWTFLMFFSAIIAFPMIGINVMGRYVILLVSLIVTLYAAPVYHVQREHLLIGKAKKGKIISCIITLFWAIILLFYKDNVYATSVLWIIFLQNMQLLYEYLKRKKMKAKEEI